MSQGAGTQQRGLEGGWDPMPTCTPYTRGAEWAPTVPKKGGQGWQGGDGGPRQQGRLRVRLPPARGPRQGSPPRNYSIRRKITEQGGSLPTPFPATLPEPPPPSPPFPKPSWHRIHGRSPGAAAGSSSPSETSLCPRLPQWVLGPQHTLLGASLPLPLQPRAAPGWWGGKGLLLLSARTEPLCCPLPRKGSDPSSPHIPTGAASSPPDSAQRVWDQRSPCQVPLLLAQPQAPWHRAHPDAATLPGMTAKGPPAALTQGGRWTNPTGALSPSTHGWGAAG